MKKFDIEYSRLNKEQKEAVDTIEGPVMVVAGPGTGKTQILAMRVANILLKTQVNPSNILALTFTNSGVYQMRKRLLDIVGLQSYNVHVHTFHSFSNEIIHTFPEKFIFAKEINQLMDLEQILLLQSIIDQTDLELIKPLKAPYHYTRSIIQSISDLKQEGVDPNEFKTIVKRELEAWSRIEDLKYEKGANEGKVRPQYEILKKQILKNQELSIIYDKYQKELETLGKYDYADMILFVLNALKNDDELLGYYQEKFQYILVDEYQDTNSAQNEIVKILASFHPSPNVFVVGDDEQSIFRFQGASLENVLSFQENYKESRVIVLNKNYRSTQEIINASRSVIENNKNQIFNLLKIDKDLKSMAARVKGKISLAEFSQGALENYFVAKEIQELIKSKLKPSEIAVLYKEHRDAEELSALLAKLNIPYQLETGESILADPEIIKLVKIIKAVDRPNDDELIFEIMHYPFFKITDLDCYKLTLAANKEKKHLFELASNLPNAGFEKPKRIKEFAKLMLEFRNIFFNKIFTEAFDFLINESGYLEHLLKLDDSVHHLNRLQTFFKEIKSLNMRTKDLGTKEFISHIDALEDNGISIKEEPLGANFEGVRLMTAHKSKGLEFENIFIIHTTDKHWGNTSERRLIKLPSSLLKFDSNKDENDEEERRLFYVALTRAKKNIYITYAEKYSDDENATIHLPSKFISELSGVKPIKIDTTKIEKAYKERISLGFSPRLWEKSKKLDDFIKTLLNEFKLSATSFNAYLECPYKFFLNNLIRVPKVKSFDQSYGTAIHKALELFFKKYLKDLKLPPKSILVENFVAALGDELLNQADQGRALKWGTDNLSKYYDFYQDEWRQIGPPINVEYDFKYHNVHFNGIPLTGKIDKIQLTDSVGNLVKISDYKTSKPKSLNALLGLTSKKDLGEFYQACFYKLLTEEDKQFRWRVKAIEFDFISPDKDKFKRVAVPIKEEQFKEFKELVKSTYKDICALKFDKNKKSCKKYDRPCEYSDLCHH